MVLRPSKFSGKSVTLVQLVYPNQFFKNPVTGTVEAMHHSVDFPCWLVTGDICSRSFNDHGWALFKPELLLPIDGDDDQTPEYLTKDKPVEVTA